MITDFTDELVLSLLDGKCRNVLEALECLSVCQYRLLNRLRDVPLEIADLLSVEQVLGRKTKYEKGQEGGS